MTTNFTHFLLALIFVVASSFAAFAQTEEEKSTVISYVETQLSAPNRKISLNGLKGALSSNVELDSITISDQRGVWLKITNPKLVWNRSALFRGKLDIESLTADRIEYYRKADVDESLPSPEASSFELPQLPVAVAIDKIDVPLIKIEQSVFGLAAEVSVSGKVALDDGELDLAVLVNRLDGPRGRLNANTKYVSSTQTLTLDLDLDEPENGVIANLLELKDRPPVSLKVVGNAPISDLVVSLAFDVTQKRILSGQLKLQKIGEDYEAVSQLSGPIASIMSQEAASLLGEESRVNARALFAQSGEISLEQFSLKSGSILLNATGKRLADGFVSAFNVDARLASQGQARVLLPTKDAQTSVGSAAITLNYDAERNSAWSGKLKISSFQKDDIQIETVSLDAGGTVTGLDQTARSVSFTLDGLLDGFQAADPALNSAVGSAVRLAGSGQWRSDAPLELQGLRISGDTFQLVSTGSFAERAFNGSVELQARRLAAFSALVERDLSGGISLRTDGKVWPISGAFDLRINGTASALAIGEAQIDRLLAGETTLSGGIARDEEGLNFRNLRIANSEFQTELKGRFGNETSSIQADARLRDLATITPRGSGEVALLARLTGTKKPFTAQMQATMEKGTLSGRMVEGLSLAFEGETDLETVIGALSSSGSLDRKPIVLRGEIDAGPEIAKIEDMNLRVGDSQLSGGLLRNEFGLYDATLKIDAGDISDLAALITLNAGGSVRGNIQLAAADGKQSGEADLRVQGFRYDGASVADAKIDAVFKDLFGIPAADGTISAQNISVSGVNIAELDGTVATSGETTRFDINAAMRQNAARVSAAGTVSQANNTQTIALERLSVTSNITDASLLAPTQIVVRNGIVQLGEANIGVGSGSILLTGRAGSQLALSADIRNVPLSIINAIRPETRAAGTLSGQVNVSGSSSNPSAQFDFSGSDITVAQIADAGVSPLSFSAVGSYVNKAIRFDNARARNGQDISLSASGRLPLSGDGMGLTVDGTFPLALAERAIAERGASISGTGKISVFVTGSLQEPVARGFIEARGATLTDPLSNLRVTDINIRGGISGDTVTLSEARGQLASGGSVSARGDIGLGRGLPANIRIELNRAKYTDGQTFTTTADGTLTLSGDLAANPSLEGTINLIESEIVVPESFIQDRELLDVRHVRVSAGVRRTLERVKRTAPVAKPSSRPSILQLDLTINAPNRIFVRGRGLDAELGGRVRIAGSAVNIRPIGSFQLLRGRLSILGQRIDLDEGTITLAGDLDPLLDLVARTEAGDVTAFIKLEGRASQLEVTFTSSPELPQDEVLALIIFGRGLGDLSPAQIVRLASIAGELTGGNSPGLVEEIRRGTGLDNLDIVQDSDGNAAVRAGKYISDKVYLGVQAGKNTEATINLDITDNVKVRGALSSTGESNIGVFLEKNY
ncbi:translocation/assembly module TamB domain-containing protein [Pseudahrensia aquimaris]|uniref:Translocation/assembly module TamB domain-containing protein n=1 Tax=Pseudahrensia aquimaris TaxID=744461 RepID=A0ABW3FIX3_9HYPH